jgi:hypothetical protein
MSRQQSGIASGLLIQLQASGPAVLGPGCSQALLSINGTSVKKT